jgi:TetR/AcrR family acrAB operon transcriptional repressor
MARRTKEEALATRHRILDAAEVLFERCGVSRTSLHDIAQAADVTRGAIYWHFKDKADLFNAMMERATMPLEDSMAGASRAPDEDPLDFLQRRLVDALRLTATHPQTRRVFEIATHKVEYVDELLAVRDRHLAGRNECLAECERELKAAMRRGQLESKTSARTLALGLHAMVDGLIQNWMLDPDAFDLVRVGRQVLQAYLSGLRTVVAA